MRISRNETGDIVLDGTGCIIYHSNEYALCLEPSYRDIPGNPIHIQNFAMFRHNVKRGGFRVRLRLAWSYLWNIGPTWQQQMVDGAVPLLEPYHGA